MGKGGIARVVHDQDDPAPTGAREYSDRAAERRCHQVGFNGSPDRIGRADRPQG
jgi:hypothetical protein